MKDKRRQRDSASEAGKKSQRSKHPSASVPIVGIGASAGGLEAFTRLLKHLPPDTGLGFVLVQHLDPQHDSALVQLLGRTTPMPVRQVTHNQRVKPNHVYVIPPNTNLSIAQGRLKLQPRPQTGRAQRAIDVFFESLAQDQRERAIGVILSGTASDGTLGLEAIKAEGGITFAQDESAKYDSMPRSATAAGCVDFVLSPEHMANELARIAQHPYVVGQSPDPLTPALSPAEGERESETRGPDPLGSSLSSLDEERASVRSEAGNGFKKILLLLRQHSGVDFSLYKPSTIRRRITRRMVLNKQDRLESYATCLRGNAAELDALYSDVLISVTSFFRNPDAFDVLQRIVFPKFLRQRGDDPFRVWVLGCSTGQEAFSIAMAFMESAEHAPRMRKLQIFATDLNDRLLDKARQGLYAKSLAQDLSPERLRRFFVEEEGGYRVNKAVREMVVFARQNLISDPPFSRMDFISCRNLLIYLEPSLQKKVFPTFHYALRPEGFLLLGASESIGGFTDLFEPADKKHKLYSKKAAPTQAFHLPVKRERGEIPSPGLRPSSPLPLPSPHPMGRGRSEGEGDLGAVEMVRGELNAQREADRVTVNQFAPPGVLVNADLQILQFRGPTGAYLEPPTGKASFDVLKMAREGLMLPLRAAINKARKDNTSTRKDHVRVRQNGATRTVNVEVIPLKNVRERCFLILFQEAASQEQTPHPDPLPLRRGEGKSSQSRGESRRVVDLETDLADTRDYLQSVQEQHEAANEELQASNEEVQSANEELQSVNEELETSKEELESANEELTTINEEMANRNSELTRLNSDLVNLQTSLKLAIVLLARDLTIRRFSAQAETLLNLLAADVGRPIGHIRHNLLFEEGSLPAASAPPDLETLIADVIATVREREWTVQDTENRWYDLRVRPYFTLDNKVDGAVLVLVDITDLKRSELETKAARNYAESVIRTARSSLMVLRADLRVNTANEAFYTAFKTTPDQTEGRSLFEMSKGAWEIPHLRTLLEEIVPQNSFFNDFEVTHDFPHLGRRTMLLNARRLDLVSGSPFMILLAIEDVTDRLRAEAATASLAAIVNFSDDAIIGKDVDGVITSWNQGAERLFGYAAQEAVGRSITMLIPPDRLDEEADILARIKRGERIVHFDTVRLCKNRSPMDVSLTISPIKDATGRVIGASKIARDISARKQAEALLRQSEGLFSSLVEQAPNGMYVVDAQFCMQQVNSRALSVFSAVHPLIGRDFSEVVQILWGPKVGENIAGIFRHTLETGERYISPSFSERRHDLGVEQSYEWETQRVTLPSGEHGVVCYFADITERKQAEEKVRVSEERFRSLVSVITDVSWVTDATGAFIAPQPEWEDYTGQSWEVHRGFGWADALHPEDRERVTALWLRACETGTLYESRGRVWHAATQRWRQYIARAAPLFNPDGSVREWVGTCTDIEELERTEEALHRLNEELEARVEDRTRELVASQMLLRGLAADLNLAEQRERQRLATELHDYLAQLLVLTKLKLAQAKKQPMALPLTKIVVELEEVMDQALTYTRTLVAQLSPPILSQFGLPVALKWLVEQMKQRDLAVSLQLDSEPLSLAEDQSVLLFQSIRELLMNIVKHAGTNQATIAMIRSEEALHIVVEDQGAGFDLAAAAAAAAAGTSTVPSFGLFSIRERMLSLGGRFELRSRSGEGTTATLVLPLTPKAASSESSLTAKESAESPHLASPLEGEERVRGALRVLLADDHLMVRQGLHSLLDAYHDISVVGEAADGEEAVDMAGSLAPDVIVMDVNMAKLDGIEATRRVKSRWPGIIVVGLSVSTSAQVESLLLEAGASCYVSKEAAGDQLYGAIVAAVRPKS